MAGRNFILINGQQRGLIDTYRVAQMILRKGERILKKDSEEYLIIFSLVNRFLRFKYNTRATKSSTIIKVEKYTEDMDSLSNSNRKDSVDSELNKKSNLCFSFKRTRDKDWTRLNFYSVIFENKKSDL
jgi:siroheme synthase (precorrin-2 oxidase/ferrochelatase)